MEQQASNPQEINDRREEENKLLLRCQNGDNEAMEEMLNRYKNMVRSKAMALYLVGADKEDLIHDRIV